jgi:hypothetical protein
MNHLSPNNRIKADAGKLGGAARQVHWRRGLCGAFGSQLPKGTAWQIQ